MSVFLSLQGCMAVGKTTAARYVEENRKDIFVSYENPAPLLQKIKEHGWDQNTVDGFVNIQRLFIKDEIERWEKCRQHKYVLMDLGANEIEFFTLFYPRSRGFDWDIENRLKEELTALRQCVYLGVLFLDANTDTLIQHKEKDTTRKRGSFDHYLGNMLNRKKEWFSSYQQPKTDFLKIDGMTKEQVGQQVIIWIDKFVMSGIKNSKKEIK
jgi:hypothetical protein